MDAYIDIMYINRLGAQLKNFKQSRANTWAFSHSCEKTSRGKNLKIRGSIYEHKNTFFVKCFHCGFSTNVQNFLKETSPGLYEEYRLEAYRGNEKPEEVIEKQTIELEYDTNLNGLIPVSKLPKSSSVLKFLAVRKIPEKHYKLLYVSKHFYQWATAFKPEFAKIQDDSPRLVIPYFDLHGRILGFTARTFSPTVEPRYIHLRIDKQRDFIYGTERIDPSRTIYVTEGQIDSLFIDNAVAIGGANYDTDFMHSIKTNCVIIPDSDWKRNAQVSLQLKKVIAKGFKVCLLPDTIKGKDLNDMVKNGLSLSDLKELVDSHVYNGLSAMLEFALQKKV